MDSGGDDDREENFVQLAERERARLQKNAVKQGFISTVEAAKIQAAQAAYGEVYARHVVDVRARTRAEVAAALGGAS